ncbi:MULTISPECIES: hypothetical protein [unclassified Novosphingobium]|uniref:hypothetical protein n=1 Tax=unclassified Novosphingobium TaxID=2644732 RepID=UPI001359A86F|nr:MULTISPECIES: hypothetical protein [unclassified Novosphingobium]
MGLLDGGLASIFNAAFSGIYLPATLHAGTGEPIYGPGGTITGYEGGDTPCKAQVDAATDAMRRADGFAEGDCRVIVLAVGVGEITSDHEISVKGVRYRLMAAELDAAASHWVCRGRRA